MNTQETNQRRTFRQVPFEARMLNRQGFMTGALGLVSPFDGETWVGYQLLDRVPDRSELHPVGRFRDGMLDEVVKDIIGHTVNSQWKRPLVFRIEANTVYQDLILRRGIHNTPMNAVAAISHDLITVHAVDRDWQRIDSNVAHLADYYPFTLATEAMLASVERLEELPLAERDIHWREVTDFASSIYQLWHNTGVVTGRNSGGNAYGRMMVPIHQRPWAAALGMLVRWTLQGLARHERFGSMAAIGEKLPKSVRDVNLPFNATVPTKLVRLYRRIAEVCFDLRQYHDEFNRKSEADHQWVDDLVHELVSIMTYLLDSGKPLESHSTSVVATWFANLSYPTLAAASRTEASSQ